MGLKEGVKLFKHQLKGVELARSLGSMALFYECGTGKTLTGLAIYSMHRAEKDLDLKMLVVVSPKTLIETAWSKDIETFTDYTYASFKDMKDLDKYPDIVLINYELLKARYAQVEKMIKKGNWMCFCDESSKMKDFKSLNYKSLNKLRDKFIFRYVASGTPNPNSDTELWTQINFIRKDLLPTSFYQFRNLYFYLAKDYKGRELIADQAALRNPIIARGIMQQGYKYRITPDKKKKLYEVIAPYCHWVEKKDALDLPDRTWIVRKFELSKEEYSIYKNFKKEMVLEMKDIEGEDEDKATKYIAVDNALSKLLKLRQLSSGFAYYEDFGGRKTHLFGNSKLKALEDVLEDLGPKQVIIWAYFQQEIDSISEMLEKKGLSFCVVDGKTKDKVKAVKDFFEGKVQYVVANPHCAGHGITWTNCDTAVYYSLDFSYETYAQSNDRTHRAGQDKKCTYIHLLADKTEDYYVYDCLKNKKSRVEIMAGLMKRILNAS